MTCIIAVPVAVAYVAGRGGGPHFWQSPDAGQAGLVALAVFALWCLCFLPGWLYVRFLGRRAGALWHEYVLHLHRLGWDGARFLPRPLRSSQYFQEWRDEGGYLQATRNNIYRMKFDAAYGHRVADSAQSPQEARRTNFAVRADTMFPVFLATAVLAAGWATVLWDTGFVVAPSGGWDVLKFGFLGSYAFILQSLIRRFFQNDLRPSAYSTAVQRVVVVVLTLAALHQLMNVAGLDDPKTQAVVGFVAGLFPTIALHALRRFAGRYVLGNVPELTPRYPLNQLDGLNVWYEDRLLEEGVEDMQNLVTMNSST